MPITNQGYISATATDSLASMQQVFINTFGNQVNLVPQSINGIFIQELTNLSINVENSLQYLYSGVYNPNISTGIFLDSIGKFNAIDRVPATSSQVEVQITGLSGTIIPINSQILNSNGDIFINQEIITIDNTGNASGTFISQNTGEINVDANSINRIVQNINGWSTVNNQDVGILGNDIQSDFQYRRVQQYSKSLNSTGFLNALVSALYANKNVDDFYVVENSTASPIVKNGVTISPHSIYASVYGGTNQEIANIIASKKSAGCGMDGNTNVIFNDNEYPWVEYNITFQRPTPVPIYVDVTIKGSVTDPSNLSDLVKQAILDNFNGLSDEPKVSMGDDFYAGRFYPSITDLGVYKIVSIFIGINPSPTGTSISLPISSVPVLDISDINVTIT